MIELSSVSKSFNGHRVLDGMSIAVERGQTVVIIGRSGCGKSVTLKHMIGLMRPDSGKVIVDGKDITALSVKDLNRLRMRFGMLFQGAALFDSLTVEENVGFALFEHTDMSRQKIDKRVEEALALVGLKGIERMKPAELSGGMRKRVGLARSLCMKPEIMLYDEPTTGVDPITGDAINELIRELNTKLNVTAVAVTHDMASAYKIADKIAMLYEGKIIESGSPDEIRNTKNPYVKQFITGASRGPIKLLED